ncbi:hypothetical protein HAX54_045264 [Datura stramonium]|uniref:Uncharacterized protein n=1 Tax=Datura stramonium TaxID=4076 RepID=A0ABS8RH74_DATST|nr:hypothetical protein [Datura stramonium]
MHPVGELGPMDRKHEPSSYPVSTYALYGMDIESRLADFLQGKSARQPRQRADDGTSGHDRSCKQDGQKRINLLPDEALDEHAQHSGYVEATMS